MVYSQTDSEFINDGHLEDYPVDEGFAEDFSDDDDGDSGMSSVPTTEMVSNYDETTAYSVLSQKGSQQFFFYKLMTIGVLTVATIIASVAIYGFSTEIEENETKEEVSEESFFKCKREFFRK